MGQHTNEHLTIAQLSAYLDKELTRDELALCEAHLQACPRCRAVLADLRATSALLQRMPQVEVPRSFVLPSNIAVLPAASERQEPRRVQSLRSQSGIKRSLRALSTLAAVIGLLFILVGALSSLPHGGYATNTASAPISSGLAPNRPTTPPAFGTRNATSPPGRTTVQAAGAQATARAQHRQTPEPTPTAAPATSTPDGTPGPQASLPAVLDPGQPEGRLSIGAVLLLLGMLGVLLTRRPRGGADVS